MGGYLKSWPVIVMIIVMSLSCSCHAQSQYLRQDSQHVYTDPGISDDELYLLTLLLHSKLA